MRRREFIAAIGGAAASAWPLAAYAQQAERMRRVGVLLPGSADFYANRIATMRRGLGERGYVEARTLELVFRFSGPELDRLPALARELVAAQVEVIVTASTPATRAAMAATSKIPIVIASTADAVSSGLIANLARPGGNVTGSTILIPELGAKQLELIRELVPGLARIAVLRGRGEGANAFETIGAATTAHRIDARFEEIESADGIAPAFAAMAATQCQAVILVDGPSLNLYADLVAKLMIAHLLPGISTLRLFVDAGSLVSYGPNLGAMWYRAAYFVDRILKGTSPSELPIEQPTKFDLVVNRKTATTLGITIPQSILVRADEVIE